MSEIYTALFHKMEIDGKIYYECRYVVSSFTPNEKFDSLLNRINSTKNDFFITASIDKLKSKGIQKDAIFVEDNGLRVIHDPIHFNYVKKRFASVNNVLKDESPYLQELIDDYVKKIVDDSKCQKDAVRKIISTIVYNCELNKSSLTSFTRNMHHDNIVMYGPVGWGDDLVLEGIKKNLLLPVIEITLSGNIETDIKVLIKKIEENEREFNGNALVIVDCNYDAFAEQYDGDCFYPLREFLNYAGTYHSTYLKKTINFHDLTYLTNVNIAGDISQVENLDNYFMELTGCTKVVPMKKPSMAQVKRILYDSVYSVINYCKEQANKYNRELVIKRAAIIDAIKYIHLYNDNVVLLNTAILESFKDQIENGLGKVIIGREIIEYIEGVANFDEEEEDEEVNQNDDMETVEEDNSDREDSDLADKITKEITKTIRAQDRQVYRIVKTILRNLQYANDADVKNPEKHKKNILIRGDSGTGKTEIIRRLASIINVPIYVADATQYTEEGYVGDSVNDMLLDLYHNAGDDIEKAQKGILVIDEIDKKANGNNRSDISRGAVLQSLLKIVEGTKKRIKYEKALPSGAVIREKLDFDTTRLTVVCLGAFENLERFRDERVRKELKPTTAGFKSNSEIASQEKKYVNRNFTNEDYEAYGMSNQFIPRFISKVYLNKLNKENLIDIMKNSNLSALKLKQEDYLLDDVIIEYTDDFCEKLAEIALTKKSGARAIGEALEDIFDNLGLNDLNTSSYSKIILNGDCIENVDALILIPRQKQKVKKLK